LDLNCKKDQANYYEVLALRYGTIINIVCSITGFVFFLITRSMSILLDTLISVILCASTVISIIVSNKKTNNSNLETKFLIFRAFIMLAVIIYTIIMEVFVFMILVKVH